MNQNLKEKLRRSHLFQLKKAKDYFENSSSRYAGAKKDEKYSSRRICFLKKEKADQYVSLMEQTKISIRCGTRYQSWLDTGLYFHNVESQIDNIPPEYSSILNHSLNDLIDYNLAIQNDAAKSNVKILRGALRYTERAISAMDATLSASPAQPELRKTRTWFERMGNSKAESLEEALQRILFWSSIFWQSQHVLVGLGRLDRILEQIYRDDPADSSEKLAAFEDFLKELHRYYSFKSSALLGDTGQIIILGGMNPDGSYFCNDLTYLIIKALKNVHLPDPKVLLRVAENMPDDLLRDAVACIATGIGSPLLSNDEVVVPALQDFGYSREDACNYVTSACWEPLAYGQSLEKNNLRDLNYAQALVDTYRDPQFETLASYDAVVNLFLTKLTALAGDIRTSLDEIRWEDNPLMTLFTSSCLESGQDIARGGSRYKDYGILTSGLSNAVNSLLNIRNKVFEQPVYTLKQLKQAAENNFEGSEALQKDLFQAGFYGKDDSDVIALVKRITQTVYDNLCDYRNKLGGTVKWGLSSSNYAIQGKKTDATLDGRMKGEPLGVHISNMKAEPLTELILFSTKMSYRGKEANGNVVDMFVSPNLIVDNADKFVTLLKVSIQKGFFQMQMNVVSSSTLIAARQNPEAYPDLIVRVWGFSAYFNDLSDTYKDLLIKRALESEKAC